MTQVADNGVVSVLLRDEGRDVRVGDRVLPVEAQPYDPYFYPSAMASYPEVKRIYSERFRGIPRCLSECPGA